LKNPGALSPLRRAGIQNFEEPSSEPVLYPQ
jgi:hypothetical protein